MWIVAHRKKCKSFEKIVAVSFQKMKKLFKNVKFLIFLISLIWPDVPKIFIIASQNLAHMWIVAHRTKCLSLEKIVAVN
jgi:hypothetical protein